MRTKPITAVSMAVLLLGLHAAATPGRAAIRQEQLERVPKVEVSSYERPARGASRGRSSSAPRQSPASPTALPGAGVEKLSLCYSNNIHGTLSPCGCPNAPAGGVARRAWYVNRSLAQKVPTLFFSSGDEFFNVTALKGASPKDLAGAEVVASSLGSAHLGAMVPGDLDLSQGVQVLLDLETLIRDSHRGEGIDPRREQFLVASNIILRPGAEPLAPKGPDGQPYQFLASKILQAPGSRFKVGVIGITRIPSQKVTDSLARRGYTVVDPIDPQFLANLRRLMAGLRSETDLVVGLLHQAPDRRALFIKALASDPAFGEHALPDVVIAGHSEEEIRTPLVLSPTREHGTLVVSSGRDGYNLGILNLRFPQGRREPVRISVGGASVSVKPRVLFSGSLKPFVEDARRSLKAQHLDTQPFSAAGSHVQVSHLVSPMGSRWLADAEVLSKVRAVESAR